MTIARIWTGWVLNERADAYLQLMADVAVPDYRSVAGNLAAWCLHVADGDYRRVTMLTFWRDLDAIREFAGDDLTRAKYYDFDAAFLRELPERVEHFEMFGERAAADTHPKLGNPLHGA